MIVAIVRCTVGVWGSSGHSLFRIALLEPMAYLPGLPDVPSLVCSDDIKARGDTEPDPAHEWVSKPYTCQIEIGLCAEKFAEVCVR